MAFLSAGRQVEASVSFSGELLQRVRGEPIFTSLFATNCVVLLLLAVCGQCALKPKMTIDNQSDVENRIGGLRFQRRATSG